MLKWFKILVSVREGWDAENQKYFINLLYVLSRSELVIFISWDTYVKAQGSSHPSWDNVPTLTEFIFLRLPLVIRIEQMSISTIHYYQ